MALRVGRVPHECRDGGFVSLSGGFELGLDARQGAFVRLRGPFAGEALGREVHGLLPPLAGGIVVAGLALNVLVARVRTAKDKEKRE